MSWITNIFKRRPEPTVAPTKDIGLFLEHMEVLDRLIALSKMRQALMDKLDSGQIELSVYEKVDAGLKAESAELRLKHKID